MKGKSYIAIVIITCAFICACKKDPGPGGKNTINGTVYFYNGATSADEAAPMATVAIAYGTDQPTTTFSKRVLAGSDGSFSFEGLQKGKYYIEAHYTDAHGFSYSGKGSGVILNHRKKEIATEIRLK